MKEENACECRLRTGARWPVHATHSLSQPLSQALGLQRNEPVWSPTAFSELLIRKADLGEARVTSDSVANTFIREVVYGVSLQTLGC
jgi:hypothetical protein